MNVTNITDVMLLLTIVDNSYINLKFISAPKIPFQIYHFRQINLPFRKTGVDRSSKFRCRRSTSRIDTSGKIESQADWFDYKALQVYRSDSLANGSRTYFTIIVQLPAVSLLRTRRSGPPLYLVQSLRANVSTGGRHKS